MEDSIGPEKFKSRKLYMSLLALALLTTGFFAREGLDSLEGVYGEYVTGIIGVLGLYLTGNVMNKHVITKKEIKEEEYDPNS